MKAEQPEQIKLVMVGDGQTGKTSILLSYMTNKFPTEYVPTIFDNKIHFLRVDNQPINLSLWDTAGQQNYERLRLLAYPNSDIFIIVFAVDAPDSFTNAKKKWYPDVCESVPNALVIFVGNKIDTRSESSKVTDLKLAPIRKQTGSRVFQNEMKKVYLECSAKTREGVENIFNTACHLVLNKRKGRTSTGEQIVERSEDCYCVLI